MGNSTPSVAPAPKLPQENDPSIEAALQKERLLRQRKAGRASTILSDQNQGGKQLLGE